MQINITWKNFIIAAVVIVVLCLLVYRPFTIPQVRDVEIIELDNLDDRIKEFCILQDNLIMHPEECALT